MNNKLSFTQLVITVLLCGLLLIVIGGLMLFVYAPVGQILIAVGLLIFLTCMCIILTT